MSNLENIVDTLSKLTVLEAAELSKLLEEKWGVSAAAPMQAIASVAEGPAAAAEKTNFDIILSSIGDKKIEVIKVVREITGLGLKEAKDLVETASAVIKKDVSKADAESIKTKLEATGAKVEVK